MEIWYPGILFAVITTGFIVFLFYRFKPKKRETNPELHVYSQQLEEFERQQQAGMISSDELVHVKAELGRKILNSEKKFQNSIHVHESPLQEYKFLLSIIIVLTLVLGSQTIHNFLGAPGYGDQPYKTRIEASQTLKDNRLGQVDYLNSLADFKEEEIAFTETIKRLEAFKTLGEDEYQANLRLSIQASLAENKLFLTSQLYNQLILFLGEKASLKDLISNVEVMIYSAQLYVSPEAESMIIEILKRDPTHLEARFYLGLMYEQVLRPDLTFELWNTILVDNPDLQTPLMEYIKTHIGDVARKAGIDLS